jgi:hypothetical protein
MLLSRVALTTIAKAMEILIDDLSASTDCMSLVTNLFSPLSGGSQSFIQGVGVDTGS